jgi:hypothetical protein
MFTVISTRFSEVNNHGLPGVFLICFCEKVWLPNENIVYYLKHKHECFIRYKIRGDCRVFLIKWLKNDPSYEFIGVKSNLKNQRCLSRESQRYKVYVNYIQAIQKRLSIANLAETLNL